MFQDPLCAVGLGHSCTIDTADVAEGDQSTQSVEGSAGPDPLVTAAVNELQKLHRELGVP